MVGLGAELRIRYNERMNESWSRSLRTAAVSVALLSAIAAQQHGEAGSFTKQEQLRGSVTKEREWWDVLHYDLQLHVFPETKSLTDSNTIDFKVLNTSDRMQIDLRMQALPKQTPLGVIHSNTCFVARCLDTKDCLAC